LIRKDNAQKQTVLNNAMQVNDFYILKDNSNTEDKVIAKEDVKEILYSLCDVEYKVAMLTSSGFNVSEIANRLNISKSSVCHIRIRVRKKIKNVQNS
jgi:DNA-binding NarL/FixJ family response regulator